MRGFRLGSGIWVGALLLGLSAAATIQSQVVRAQLSECQPPRPEEYLLLVPNRQANTQSELRRLLPNNAVLTPCNYLNDEVIRVEGFASAEIASAWAKYLLDAAGLQAVVSRPNVATAASPSPSPAASPAPSPAASPAASPAPNPVPSPAASPTPNPAPNSFPSPAPNPAASPAPSPIPSPVASPSSPTASPTPAAVASPNPAASPAPSPVPNPAASPAPSPAPQLAYNPQPLGAGFAVVVNYFNDPDIANRVRQVTTREVGLVAFEQQPYLLASYTTDAAAASLLLKTLSERGLTAAIVDSRRTVLLTPAVRVGR